MNFIIGYPPNIEAIDAVFHVRRMALAKLAFCWGESIYQPRAWTMPADYVFHEQVHAVQQRLAGGPEIWWDKFLVDKQFRLEAEIGANRAQWAAFLERMPSRQQRRSQLAWMASLLAGPVYGHMIGKGQARREITNNQGDD